MRKVTAAPGVYGIRNKVNGKMYVGSAARSIKTRVGLHRAALVRGDHDNSHLQRAWNKYGPDAFEFGTLELCTAEVCISREQYWIDFFRTADGNCGYNLCPTAGSMLGFNFGENHGAKVSAGTKTAMARPEVRERLKVASRKRWEAPGVREEWRKKMTAVMSSREIREKLKAGQRARLSDPDRPPSGNTVLTEEAVREIRRLYRWHDREFGSPGLAKKFGVSQYAIMCVLQRKTWKHVT